MLVEYADRSSQETQPAYEDTSTLVLTAPSSTFIDVRFPIAADNSSQTTTHPSLWAFSGEVTTSFYNASSTQPYSVGLPYTAHCEFIHDIDTRGPGIIDSGDMCLLPNGECLEFGHMINPATGRDEPYKEYWCSAGPLPRPDGADDSKICLVARVASPSNTEGVVIRIGGRVQGIISRRQDDGTLVIEVERWTRDPKATEQSDHQCGENSSTSRSEWYRDPRSTGSFVPVEWLDSSERRIGDNHEHNEILWNLTEL